MLTGPGEDRHEEEGQQERPREMDLKRGRQGEAEEKEARPRRYQVCREGDGMSSKKLTKKRQPRKSR
jgi:hypothetical protein